MADEAKALLPAAAASVAGTTGGGASAGVTGMAMPESAAPEQIQKTKVQDKNSRGRGGSKRREEGAKIGDGLRDSLEDQRAAHQTAEGGKDVGG